MAENVTAIHRRLAGRIELEESDEHFTAGDAVALALDAASTLEGAALEDVVDCYAALNEAGASPASTESRHRPLVDRLRDLSGLTASAADAIQAQR